MRRGEKTGINLSAPFVALTNQIEVVVRLAEQLGLVVEAFQHGVGQRGQDVHPALVAQRRHAVQVMPVEDREAQADQRHFEFRTLVQRVALDELAVKIACDKISEKELQKLLEVKDQFENSTKTGDVKMIAEMDVKFHDVIFESTGNPKLVTLLDNLREQIYRYRVEYIKNPDNYPVLIAEHNAIAEGLKNRDKEAATLAMHKHVKNQAVAVKSVIQCQDEAENE